MFLIIKKGFFMSSNTPECVLELDSKREIISGSYKKLAEALDRGADLLIATAFYHNEHLMPGDSNHELVEELSDFRMVIRVGEEWSAGIMNLRMPANGSYGFGPRASWSFFLYNCDGTQGIARPYLDNESPKIPPTGENKNYPPSNFPKYEILNKFDTNTNAPSENFIYDFEYFRYFVRDQWQEVYAVDEQGNCVSGSLEALVEATKCGRELKAAIRNFQKQPDEPDYEIFTFLGSSYYSTESKDMTINSQPVVIVRPNIPMRYASNNWRSGNMLLKNNGEVHFWSYDPYTMEYSKSMDRCAIRYFVR